MVSSGENGWLGRKVKVMKTGRMRRCVLAYRIEHDRGGAAVECGHGTHHRTHQTALPQIQTLETDRDRGEAGA